MGCICTYASYFSKNTNLLKSATQIGVIDFLVAILAGLVIFPAAFSVGVKPDSGPSLIFITLPNVFQQAFSAFPTLGYFISLLFYALLSMAALTSLISLHEVSTAFLEEEMGTTRKHAAVAVTVAGRYEQASAVWHDYLRSVRLCYRSAVPADSGLSDVYLYRLVRAPQTGAR